MNTFKKSIVAGVLSSLLVSLSSCSDANEYEDAFTDNPSWVEGYTDSLKIAHPESLASTTWVRGSGLKTNAYGQEVQGVLFAKLMNLLSKEKINPLIGAAGVSAVPMAARVANKVGLEANPQNFLLMHAMGPNVAGVIGSAVAAGVLLAICH